MCKEVLSDGTDKDFPPEIPRQSTDLQNDVQKHDCRALGKQLELFAMDSKVGSDMVLWLPKGATMRHQLEHLLTHAQEQLGFQTVYSPILGSAELFRTSGILQKLEPEDAYFLRSVICPYHVSIYQNRPRSYRELPLRLAEFGIVTRNETLDTQTVWLEHLRTFTQDDAHLFCTEEQVAAECRACFHMTRTLLESFNFQDIHVFLTVPESETHVSELWGKMQSMLENTCREAGLDVSYSPRVDGIGPRAEFAVTDRRGRMWKTGAIQLDFRLPSDEGFDLSYIGADNHLHRPIVIHHSVFGSFERFIGILIEHFDGVFPMWLAPEQVRILVVSQKHEQYAHLVENRLRAAGLRVSGDYRSEKIGAKIRRAQLLMIPYMLIIGEREEAKQTVSLRHRFDGSLGEYSLEAALERFQAD